MSGSHGARALCGRPEAASLQWRAVADQIRPKVPKMAAILDAAEPDEFAYMTVTKEHRAKLHTAGCKVALAPLPGDWQAPVGAILSQLHICAASWPISAMTALRSSAAIEGVSQ